jgi:ferrochelatase
LGEEGLDYAICYQSRATPQKWLDPSTEVVIEKAAEDRVAVLVVPIAFVSDHSETLVELDVEYRELAEKMGVPGYYRAPAQNSDAGFIAALAALVTSTRERGPGLCSFAGGRACPATHTDCPMRLAA